MRDRRQSHRHDLGRKAGGLTITRPISSGNGDEFRYRLPDGRLCYLASFTKCLQHDADGFLANPDDYAAWVLRCGSGVELEPRLERHQSAGAGLAAAEAEPNEYLPPSPSLDSQELIAEMGELYWMALCRDLPFACWRTSELFDEVRESLGRLWWFREDCTHRLSGITDSLPEAQLRRRVLSRSGVTTVPLNRVFRGVTHGEEHGPYLSQFLLIGNVDTVNAEPVGEGVIAYGAIRMNQRVRIATPGRDFLQSWGEWLEVQNGVDLRSRESYGAGYRFIATPRDLATYVHRDTLYEAYLNTALILLGLGAPFDPGLPSQLTVGQSKRGFAQIGGPHMLALVTEAASRTQKAVRYQKFNVHRRARPEALGGWLYQRRRGRGAVVERLGALSLMEAALAGATGIGDKVAHHNGLPENWLLPQAYSEGSPNHPSYGASYAAVAGACATVLKAWFDSSWTLRHGHRPIAFEPLEDGSALRDVSGALEAPLTVEGEINKLAANIALGRSWAGVHYYSDCFESLRLGERIALNLLKEQKDAYGDAFSPTVPLFDGTRVRI